MFMENWLELSSNYRQIPSLSVLLYFEAQGILRVQDYHVYSYKL